MKLKLSHTKVAMYTDCPKKYDLWYNKRLRPKKTSGALIFGNAVDKALNTLLETRNIDEANKMFLSSLEHNTINNKNVYIPDSTLVAYAKRDFDQDLLLEEDINYFMKYRKDGGFVDMPLNDIIRYLKGDNLLNEVEQKQLSLLNWLCLKRKGLIMIRDYNAKVMPRIKEVIAVQKAVSLSDGEGNEIMGFLDLVIKLDDGKTYLMDNKTSSIEYEKDSAMNSQQLVMYYHAEKEQYGLDGVGFIVMYKNIEKNKTKECSVCKYDGTGKNHKTCPNLINDVRCGGEWAATIKPECRIEIITNTVHPVTEELVIETFDAARNGIIDNHFGPNLKSCKNGALICPFYDKCRKGDDKDIEQL